MSAHRRFVAALLLSFATVLVACDRPASDEPTASPGAEPCEAIDPQTLSEVIGDDDYVARTDGQLGPPTETTGIHCSVRSRSAPNPSIRVSVYQTSVGAEAEMARLKKNMVDEGECSLADADSVGQLECHHDDPSSDVSAPGVQLVAERDGWLVQASVFRWSDSSTQERDDAAAALVEYASNQLAEALAES